MAGSVVFDAQTRVTGGDKLYTFIDKLQSPQLYEKMAERFVREFPMQLFRQRLPEGATGRLRQIPASATRIEHLSLRRVVRALCR